MHRPQLCLVVSLFALFAAGCQDNPYETNAVSAVTLDGAPLPDARVSFYPEEGRPSFGVTDANGRYELNYVREIQGAELGSHKVSITSESNVLPDGRVQPEKIPAKYNVRTTLTAEVAEGSNEIDFALKSKGK